VHTLRPTLTVPGSRTLSSRTVRLAALHRMLAAAPDAHPPATVHSRSQAATGDTSATAGEPVAPHPPAATPTGKTCTCGHDGLAHQHYRRGKDCSLCSCSRFTGPLARHLPWRH
jgi:hypothetical protein